MARRRQPLPDTLPRKVKRAAGRTSSAETPLQVRADGVHVDERLAAYVRERSGRKLGKFAYHVERVTVRFVDVNGPRGGVDTECKVKIVLSGAPSVVVAKRAGGRREAFDVAADAAERALRRAVQAPGWSEGGAGRHDRSRGASPRGANPPPGARAGPPEGSLIGRRVGRSQENLRRAAERPEKLRRDVPIDTALPGRSATDRRAGGASTAARNTRLVAPRATVLLEDSAQDRPSRKSTRRSSGRSKNDNQLYLHRRPGLTR